MVHSDSSFLYNLSSFHHGNTKPPLIGITVDRIDPRVDEMGGWYSSYPWYAIGSRYNDAVVRFGGIPVMLSHNLSNIEAYSRILDGLLLVGIGVDIDPIFYGKHIRKTTHARPNKTQFEWGLTKKMMDLNKPILGINTGMQLINIIHGGTLYQHISEEKPKAQPHQQYTNLNSTSHSVKIHKKTRLFEIWQHYQKGSSHFQKKDHPILETNSYHRQAVRKIGAGLIENAKTFDNITEGIESTSLRFCIGVQWNPEFLLSSLDEALFESFIQSALQCVESKETPHRTNISLVSETIMQQSSLLSGSARIVPSLSSDSEKKSGKEAAHG